MNRRTTFIAALLAFVLVIPTLSGHEGKRNTGDETDKAKELMKKKLENSQKLLEGLVINDFDQILKYTDELMTISKSLDWKVINNPRYEIYSNQFRRTLDELTERAKEKNLDGVALSYVELTMTCVKCHKHLRGKRVILRGAPDRDAHGAIPLLDRLERRP